MAWFRLLLRSRDQEVIGCSDFHADDAISAMKIAYRVAESCPDAYAGYDLLRGAHQIVSSARATVGADKSPHALNNFEQDVVVATEIALHDSAWAIRDSRRLLDELEPIRKGQADHTDKARAYREKAEEAAIIAEQMPTAEAAKMMHALADKFLEYAKQLEELAPGFVGKPEPE